MTLKYKFWNIFFGIISIFLGSSIYLVYSDTPISIYIKRDSKVFTQYFIKEGWSFFTRNPRAETLYSYYIDFDEKKLIEEIKPSGSIECCLGVNRNCRYKASQLIHIAGKIKVSEWTKTRLENNSWNFIYEKDLRQKFVNIKRNIFCENVTRGFHILVYRKTLPILWSEHKNSMNELIRYVIIKVE